MKKKITLLVLIFAFSPLIISPSVAAIDLEADIRRLAAAVNQFDANTATSASVSTIADIKQIFSKNASILREIGAASAAFKGDLNSAKRQIPSRDTKNSPAFNTLMNLPKGYEEWLKYQNINQTSARDCITRAGSSFNSFTSCSIRLLPKTMENERIGRQKLQEAVNALKQWQVKYR